MPLGVTNKSHVLGLSLLFFLIFLNYFPAKSKIYQLLSSIEVGFSNMQMKLFLYTCLLFSNIEIHLLLIICYIILSIFLFYSFSRTFSMQSYSETDAQEDKFTYLYICDLACLYFQKLSIYFIIISFLDKHKRTLYFVGSEELTFSCKSSILFLSKVKSVFYKQKNELLRR